MAPPAAAPASAQAVPEPSAAAPAPAVGPRSSQVADLAVGALLMALGWLVLVSSVRMGIGWGSDGPESGFVPFWLSAILIGCCATILVHAVRRRVRKTFVTREQLRCVLTVLVPAAAMIFLTKVVGLYVAAALYMGFSMRWHGRYPWALAVAVPVAFALLVFVVFERWFLVPLPKGPLEAWLGY